MVSEDYVRRSDDISIVNTFTKEYTGEQTDVAIITPSSGKKIEVFGILLHSSANAGYVELKFTTSNKLVAKLYCTRQSQIYNSRMKITGAANEAITLNISGVNSGDTSFILVNYKEVT